MNLILIAVKKTRCMLWINVEGKEIREVSLLISRSGKWKATSKKNVGLSIKRMILCFLVVKDANASNNPAKYAIC